MYKINNDVFSKQPCSVTRLLDNASIPFDLANTDYQQFKKDIMAGGELQDADGAVMTPEAAQEFVKGLP